MLFCVFSVISHLWKNKIFWIVRFLVFIFTCHRISPPYLCKCLNPGTKKSVLCWELTLVLDSSSQLQQWKRLFANRAITDEDRLQCYPLCPLSVLLHYSIWPTSIMVRCSTNHRREHTKDSFPALLKLSGWDYLHWELLPGSLNYLKGEKIIAEIQQWLLV